jgi:hypothetical protein
MLCVHVSASAIRFAHTHLASRVLQESVGVCVCLYSLADGATSRCGIQLSDRDAFFTHGSGASRGDLHGSAWQASGLGKTCLGGHRTGTQIASPGERNRGQVGQANDTGRRR